MYTIQVRQPPMQTENLIGSLVPIQIPGVPTRLRVPYERAGAYYFQGQCQVDNLLIFLGLLRC